MARIKYGSIISDISGSLGGHTFSKTRSGSIIKTKHIPLLSVTSAQSRTRLIFSRLRQNWFNESDNVKNLYKNFVRVLPRYVRNSKINLSAQELYISYNYHRLVNGLSVLQTFTFSVDPLSVINNALHRYSYMGQEFFNLNMNSTPDLGYLGLTLRITPPLAQQNNNNYQRLRFILPSAQLPESVLLIAPYVALFNYVPVIGDIMLVEETFWLLSIPVVYSPLYATLTVQDAP
jgi:hypothetical protein